MCVLRVLFLTNAGRSEPDRWREHLSLGHTVLLRGCVVMQTEIGPEGRGDVLARGISEYLIHLLAGCSGHG